MVANIINLLVVAATNFILPKFTSVEVYAATKEYTLYITTYANILSAGYIQGVYLKYGGKQLNATDAADIGTDYFTFLLFQLIIAAIISLCGAAMNRTIITFLGIGLFSTNLVSYYQYLYQAVGDFKSYGLALNATRIISLLLYLLLIFGLKSQNAKYYISVPIIAALVIAVFLTVQLNKKLRFIKNIAISIPKGWSNIQGGFVLMLGSFASRLFTTIDRWFVKTLLSMFAFASYSFAVSLENLVNSFMTPLSVSLYNYFCKERVPNKIKLIKEAVSIYGGVVISAAFVAKWILEHFMVQYLDSVAVIFPLFLAQCVATIVKAVYVNQYKAEGKQKHYLHQIITMVVISILLNAVLFFLFRNMAAIAWATLLTNVIWLVICEYENPEIRFSGKTAVSLGGLVCVYLFAGSALSSVCGFVLYLISVFTVCMIPMKKSFVLLVKKSVLLIYNKLHHKSA